MQPWTWLLISLSSWILAHWACLVVPLSVPGSVSFAGSFSSPLTLDMGDPQGPVLRPLGFSLFLPLLSFYLQQEPSSDQLLCYLVCGLSPLPVPPWPPDNINSRGQRVCLFCPLLYSWHIVGAQEIFVDRRSLSLPAAGTGSVLRTNQGCLGNHPAVGARDVPNL